jgi:hypothetical protein
MSTATDAYPEPYDDSYGWTGWIVFAAALMIISGSLNFLQGLVAAFNDDWVVFGNQGALLLDTSAWGWVHMLLGALVLLAGIGILSGQVIARTIGVIVVGLGLIGNFAILPLYPFWAIILIAMHIIVIMALTVHGDVVKPK